jgi:prepilin-type processing-associated H-X9-DG protein
MNYYLIAPYFSGKGTKRSLMSHPTKAIFAFDNSQTNGYFQSWPNYMGFRHGAYLKPHIGAIFPGAGWQGKSNIVYTDGHVDSKTYRQLYSERTGAIDSNRMRLGIRGF